MSAIHFVPKREGRRHVWVSGGQRVGTPPHALHCKGSRLPGLKAPTSARTLVDSGVAAGTSLLSQSGYPTGASLASHRLSKFFLLKPFPSLKGTRSTSRSTKASRATPDGPQEGGQEGQRYPREIAKWKENGPKWRLLHLQNHPTP